MSTQELADWEHFKKSNNIPDNYGWKLFSKEYSFALEGHNDHGLTGEYLIKWVLLRVEMQNIIDEYNIRIKEIELLKKLKEKYPGV